MTIAGAPPISLSGYLPYSILPSRRCFSPMAASSTPASTSKEHQIMPKEFSYSRADPSVRWPNLKLDEHFFGLQSNFSSPYNTVAEPQLQKAEIESDGEVDQLENPETTASTKSHDDKKRRSRAKKMTKLELKRAKDWRLRAQILADQILALPPSGLVADVLDRRTVQMTPTDLCIVVKIVGNSSWTRALEAFEWFNLRRQYSPFPRMLAGIISILGRHCQYSLAQEIFQRSVAGNDAFAPCVQVFNAMMGVYARCGRFDDVRNLLEEMRNKGLEPDLVSFNTLINARAKSGQVPAGSALQLLRDVRQSGLRPDTITYNTLISACSGVPNFEEAKSIFEDMLRSKCQPDLWTYNAMISVYGRCGMTHEAEQLFHEITCNGFSPDAVSYNSILYAFAKEGSADKVESVCEKMIKAGFNMDEIAYNTIIHMFGKQGRLDLALQFYDEMKQVGCNPDAVTYTILIDLLGKAKRIVEAGKVMSEMIDARVRPTSRTFSALIRGYAKAEMRSEAEKTFDSMMRSGIKPDSFAYSVMLDIVLRACDTKRAMVLYREMRRDRFRPDDGLYQFMIAVFAKENMDELIDEIVTDMQEKLSMNLNVVSSILIKADCLHKGVEILKRAIIQGFEPNNECLSAIFDAYVSTGRYEEAQVLLDFLKDKAAGSQNWVSEASILMNCVNHNVGAALEEYNKLRMSGVLFPHGGCSLYETLITCCQETESFADSSQLFSDMKFLGLQPSAKTYRCLISSYCKMGFPETAHHLMLLAESSGTFLNDRSIHLNLIESYGKLKLWQRAESIVGKLRMQSGVDRKVWNALISAYAESGLYEQARAIFNMMIKNGPAPSVETVNGLIQALINDGRLNEIYVVIQELQDMDLRISKSTIVLMLDAFIRKGDIFEVKKIYHGMKAAGYLPTMHIYRNMISLLTRAKRVRDAELMVAEMEEVGFKPDLVVFNALLKMYTGIEDFKKTLEIYQRIIESGLNMNEDTLNTLIIMYSRDMKPEEGFAILNEMRKQDLEPKLDTYKSLLASCGKVQLWDRAEELFQSLLSKEYGLDRSFYHLMMKIYRDSGNLLKAENLLNLMKETGVEPTIATMHMLMQSYGTAGQPQAAEGVLNNLKGSNFELSTLIYGSVIEAYFKHGDYEQGIAKMLEMKNDGIETDHRIWTCFIRAASFCQHTKGAMLLLNTLCNNGFDLPIRLLTESTESVIEDVDKLLEKLEPEEDNACFNFVNSLLDLLWAFERRATGSWLFQMAIKKGIYSHDVFRVADGDWGADFRKLSGGAALVALTLWLDYMQDASLQGSPESPKSVVLITGTAEYNQVSLEKTLKAFLWEMGSPFLPCKTRTGVLVAKAHSLRMWLKESSFCMDLELKDARHLPKLNSMCLMDGYFMREGLVPAFKEIHEKLGQVNAKKFARLALLSKESREKAIEADIKGRREKMEKLKKKGSVIARKASRLRKAKFTRQQHTTQAANTS